MKRIVVEADEELHADLKALAAKMRLPVGTIIHNLVQSHLAKYGVFSPGREACMIGMGDLIYGYLPGNVQDLSLPGAQASFQAAHDVLPGTEDLIFPQSIGQDAGRFAMKGPLPGRYYGADWLAPNSGAGYGVESSLFNPTSDVADAAANLPAAWYGQPLGPMTITTPMPSVLQPRSNQVTPSDLQPCGMAQWVSKNPLPAVGLVALVYFLVRGGK